MNNGFFNRTQTCLFLFHDCRLNVDFVTSRGNLARVLNVFSSKDSKGWTMLAARYRGTVYLSHIEPDRDEKDQTPFGRRVCYWGKRFEMEVTKQDRDTISETVKLGPIRAYPGFFSVVRLQLEDHTIVLRAEVDAQMLVSEGVCFFNFTIKDVAMKRTNGKYSWDSVKIDHQ